MRDTDIALPHDIDADVVDAFDEMIAQSGLTVTLRDSLRAFPGCVHWHLKKGREAGTLELTLWPSERRAWFSVHRGRTAPWIDAELERLGNALQQRLGKADTTPRGR